MIEPHSAQLGASSWILKATFVVPSERVTVPEPLPLVPALSGAAWPLVATTASSSRAGEEAPLETEPAVAAESMGFDASTSVSTSWEVARPGSPASASGGTYVRGSAATEVPPAAAPPAGPDDVPPPDTGADESALREEGDWPNPPKPKPAGESVTALRSTRPRAALSS